MESRNPFDQFTAWFETAKSEPKAGFLCVFAISADGPFLVNDQLVYDRQRNIKETICYYVHKSFCPKLPQKANAFWLNLGWRGKRYVRGHSYQVRNPLVSNGPSQIIRGSNPRRPQTWPSSQTRIRLFHKLWLKVGIKCKTKLFFKTSLFLPIFWRQPVFLQYREFFL